MERLRGRFARSGTLAEARAGRSRAGRPVVRAVMVALFLVAAGCGSQVSHERLMADWRGEADEQAAAVAPGDGAVPASEPIPGEADSTAGRTGAGAADAGAATTSAPVRDGQAGASSSAHQQSVPSQRSAGSNAPQQSSAAAPRPNSTSAASPSGVPSQSAGEPVSGGASGASVPASPTCSAKKDPINVAGIGQWTGVIGSVIVDSAKMAQTWVRYKNAQGGINCHPLKYHLLDDGGDPSRNQALHKQAVEQLHVIAFFVNGGALTQNASLRYLEERQVPVVGTADHYGWDSPMVFEAGPEGPNALIYPPYVAAGWQAKNGVAGKKLGVAVCVEIGQCGDIIDAAKTEAPKNGLELVYTGRFSITQPDYTSTCQAAKDAGVELMFAVADSPSIKRMGRSCAAVNFRPKWQFEYSDGDLSLPSDTNFNDATTLNMPVNAWVNTENPSIASYHRILKDYGAGLRPWAGTSIGWAATQLFDLATQHLPEPPSAQGVLEGLWSIKGNDLGGITPPLTFVKGKKSLAPMCLWLVQIKGGAYVTANGGQAICS